MLAGEGAIPKSTRRAHPESQRTQEGHHGGGLSPSCWGRWLCCWGAGEGAGGAGSRQPSPGMLLGISGDKATNLGSRVPRPSSGLGQEPDPGMTFQPGFQPGTAPSPPWNSQQQRLRRCSWASAVPARTGFPGVPAQLLTLAMSFLHLMSPAAPQPQPFRRAALGMGTAGMPVGSAGGRGAPQGCSKSPRCSQMKPRMGSTGLPAPVPGDPLHPRLCGQASGKICCSS